VNTLHLRTCASLRTGVAIGLLVSLASGCGGWMAQGQNSQAVRLFSQGQYDASAQMSRKAIQSNPDDPNGYYNLAAYYHRQGKMQQKTVDLAQAESYYHQCLDRNPNHVEARRGLAVLLVEEGKPQEAFAMLQDWEMKNPTSPAPKIELARLYEEFGDKKTATDQLTAALTISPNDPRALAALGKLREDAGDHAQALANYQRSLMANRYQPHLSQRVVALQSAGAGTMAPNVSAAGTRLATSPNGTPY
jgi:tetratricopeptide (TPR) repeat protein